jgi:DNA-directed RNA polymerase subunit M/transcription elongation factor TFIIS
MEVHFCDKCEYMTELSTEDDVLIHVCNVCGYKKKVDEDDQYIYEISNESIDLSEIINSNDYKTHDVTLPKIKKNTSIKCVNTDCGSHNDPKSEITYFKYDSESMKYLYMCDHCGQTWKTS